MDKLSRVLIVGASARAAAHSAVRAGLRPTCADVFADRDLQAVAETVTVTAYPQSLPIDTAAVTDCPWMYTGALENHPQIVTRLSQRRQLLGNGIKSLQLVRNPFYVRESLDNHDLPALPIRPANQEPPADGSWLLKPIHGANGRGIQVWDSAAVRRAPDRRGRHYFQRYQAGTPISALFLATVRSTWLIGVAGQMIGTPWLNAPRFGFCGAWTPIDNLGAHVTSQITQTGRVLARTCKLRGLFGCDFICDGPAAWLAEVNPRYTASAELFEYASGCRLLDWHCRACREFDGLATHSAANVDWTAYVESPRNRRAERYAAKVILYADRNFRSPCLDGFVAANQQDAIPSIADIPNTGVQIAAGQPICSLLAAGTSLSDCLQDLQTRACQIGDCVMPGRRTERS